MKTPKDMIFGSIHKTKNSGYLQVLEYKTHKAVFVEFLLTGHQKTCESGDIRNGSVKDPYYPRVYGVGFFGEGDHKCKSGGKEERKYKIWNSMLQRCYSENHQIKNPTYKDCTVCDEWHNYQNFAEWYDSHYPSDGKSYEIDKDMLKDGNRVYSPEFCCFVTKSDNIAKALCKNYSFRSPNGEVYEFTGLKEFCKEMNLNLSCMSSVSTGLRKHHKGWTKA